MENAYPTYHAGTASTDAHAPTRGKGQKIKESLPRAASLVEAEQGRPRFITATLMQADVVNANGRRYPAHVVREAVADAQRHLHESLSQGRAILVGEAEHPSDKWHLGARFLETIVVWKEIEFDEDSKWVTGRGQMVENTLGRDAIATMEAQVLPGVSLRGYGESRIVEEDGMEIEEVIWVRFTGFDLVMDPAFQDAAVSVLENANTERQEMKIKQKNEAGEVVEVEVGLTLDLLKKEYPDLVAALVTEGRQAVTDDQKKKDAAAAQQQLAELVETLGVDDAVDAASALQNTLAQLNILEAQEKARQIAEAVNKKAADLPYVQGHRESWLELVGKPATMEEAQESMKRATAIMDRQAAELRLSRQGFAGTQIQVLGPVIETEMDIPAYARAAFEITESMVKRGDWQNRQERQKKMHPRTAAFRDEYMARFYATNQHKLIAEARMWQEAMLTSQLDLPYSVMAAIMDEAYPQLVALSIFDVGVAQGNPERIYYEANFVGETGYDVTVSNEDVTSDHDDWVSMAGKHVDFGSVVVTPNGGGTALVEGTDYVVDYLEGRIMFLSTGGSSNATIYDVDYTYNAARKGENVGIEKARTTLDYTTLNLTASRLAAEITDETIKFSQSQLGFNAVARTLRLLAKEIAKQLDANLLHNALSQALTVASNSGGTWVAATDPVSEFVEKIGVAKVKVANRYYEPTFVLLSATNSDRLANSDLFTAAGSREDALLGANGFVGRVKGLPAFHTPVFTDGYVVVGHPEIIQFRTFGNAELKGPYPSYSSNELIAADQYFIQEYNGFVSPIPGKASYVKVS